MATDFLDLKKTLPTLGVGLGLRRDLAEETFASSGRLDWLEFVPENYMGIGGRARDLIERAGERFPLVSHGINLSVGSTDELNSQYLKDLKHLLDATGAPWWSDHLCFSSVDGIYMHDLLPLPFSREAVRHIAERVKRVQDFVGRPFLLENISFYMHAPGCELTEAQFLSEVAEAADCGLLLDVNNVYVNSINHGYDARAFIDAIPLERDGINKRASIVAMIDGVHVDIVDVEKQPAISRFGYLAQKLRFRQLAAGRVHIEGDVLEQERATDKILHALDALGDVPDGLAGKGQRQQIVHVDAVDAAEAEMIAPPGRTGGIKKMFQILQVLGIQLVGAAHGKVDAVRDQREPLAGSLNQIARPPPDPHVVLGHKLQPVKAA